MSCSDAAGDAALVFRPEARDNLRRARDWYDAQRLGLGDELGRVVDDALVKIGEYPNAYPDIEGGIRRSVLFRFPYGIFYRIHPSFIEVLAVFHHRQDPAEWRVRAAV